MAWAYRALGREAKATVSRDCAPAPRAPKGAMARPRPRKVQDLIWRLEAAGFDLITLAIRALPVDLASAIGGALFRALGPLTNAHRTASLGLRLAFPDITPAEQAALLTAPWENFRR